MMELEENNHHNSNVGLEIVELQTIAGIFIRCTCPIDLACISSQWDKLYRTIAVFEW